MKSRLLLLPVLALSACSLVSPYSITFTTQANAVVDPATSTLDLVVSAPALVYISEIDCDGVDEVTLLPVVTDGMQAKTAYNLPLTALNGAAGAECEVTVTAFDQTTTSTVREEITLKLAGEETPVEEPAEETPTDVEETTDAEAPADAVIEVETEVTDGTQN